MHCSVFHLALWFGSVFCESGRRLVLDGGNVEMDIEQEILTLKQQMTQKDTEINQLRQQVSQLGTRNGATYVRWGKKECPGNGTSAVYSGYMAGTYEDRAGGSGHNYLCLPEHPLWGHYTNTLDNHIMITGVEYSFYPHYTSDIADFFGSNIHGSQAPCATCYVERGTSIMIPGRNQCYPGWTKEYDGYLVTGYPLYDDSTEFVCLDKRPDSVVGSAAVNGQNNLFFVEAKCGFDLECPPYVNGRELACVVCSK